MERQMRYERLIEKIREKYMLQVHNFYKFYLPDFLWGCSLGCGLIAIHDPGIKGVIICASFSTHFIKTVLRKYEIIKRIIIQKI